jgi:hypothetical protein
MRRSFLFGLLAPVLFAPALEAQNLVNPRTVSLRVGGRLHTQYATSSLGTYNDGFFLRRGRLTIDATFNDFIDARVQPEFVGSSVGLKDGYLRLRFAPTFQLTMGQFKRSFDLFELESSTDMSIIERDGRVGGVDACAGVGGVCSYSRFTQKLGFSDRDLGVRVAGSSGSVDYQFSMTNGTGANTSDENDAKSYSGRLGVEVADGLVIGAQLGLHDYVSDDDDGEYARAWGADLQYGDYRGGLLLQAAVVGGDNWKVLDDAGDAAGFMALQGYGSYYAALDGERLVGIEPLVRVSYGDPDTDFVDDGGVVFTPGLMVYLLGKNKIGFNVDVWSPQSGDTEYSLKVQSFLYF